MQLFEGNKPVYVALLLFSLFWFYLSQSLPVWLEEVSVYPATPTVSYAAPTTDDPGPRIEASCADSGWFHVVTSEVRPTIALCLWGRQYPLQVTSYASGIPYWVSDSLWPLHQGRVFRVRAFGLLLGFLNLLLARRLLLRFTDPVTANVAVLMLAVTPPFVVVQAMLVHFEVLPWLACAAALDQLAGCRALRPDVGDEAQPPPTGRLLTAAALIGLALISNLKTVFLLAPMALLALRAGVRFGTITPRQWVLGSGIVALVGVPSLVGMVVDGGAGISHQFSERWQFLLAQLSPELIGAEFPNLARFWGDTLLFMAIASGNDVPTSIPGPVATILPLTYCMLACILYLVRGRGPLVPAACGALMLSFLLVSALLYVGVPKGNYGPLFAVCGIATAVTLVDAVRWLNARRGWSEARMLKVAVLVVLGAFVWSLLERGSPNRFTTMPINGAAVSALGAYLEGESDQTTPIIVTTYNLTGVPEAVTGGAVRSITAYHYLDEGCPLGINQGIEPTPETLEAGRHCIQERLERLLAASPTALRFVLPYLSVPVDHALAGEHGSLLRAAAQRAGRFFQEEAVFAGQDTGPLVWVARVGAATANPLGTP